MALVIPVGDVWMTTDQLSTVLNQSIPQIPDGKTGAAVATVDASGATVAVEVEKHATKGDWTISAAYQHDWNGDDKIAGKIMYSW